MPTCPSRSLPNTNIILVAIYVNYRFRTGFADADRYL